MIAGLPGTGIGGMYYAISTLSMPFKEISNARNGKAARWNVVGRQMALATIIVGSMWITGDIVGRILALCLLKGETSKIKSIADFSTLAAGRYNVMTVPFLYWTIGAIIVLHLIIHGARLSARIFGSSHTQA